MAKKNDPSQIDKSMPAMGEELVIEGEEEEVEEGEEGEEEDGPIEVIEEEDKKYLTKEAATLYRAVVARGIYSAQDRSDIAFAVKELHTVVVLICDNNLT